MDGWLSAGAHIITVGGAAALLLGVLSIVYRSARNGISPMPSSGPVRRAVAEEIRRVLPEGGHIVDAGSGWGTLALSVAGACPGVRVTGVENSPVPFWFSKAAAWAAVRLRPRVFGRRATTAGTIAAQSATEGPAVWRIRFVRGDLYRYPYNQADAVVCYLYPGAMQRLAGLLQERMCPGKRIISVCFALPGRKPERVVTCKDLYRTKVYVYTARDEEEVRTLG